MKTNKSTPRPISHCSQTNFMVHYERTAPPHLPKTVPTLCHVCLLYHFEANGAGKVDKRLCSAHVKSLSTKRLQHSLWGKKPTRQNRCFYLHMSSRGHCKGVFDGGTSFCSLRTQRVCSEKQTRPGTTVRLTELVPTSRHRRLLPRSVRAQHFQNCYHSR